jgi:dTDP-4-amino-4,6-dideoxygalactose transaminase
VAEISEQAPLTRDELWQVLVAENVLARRYFYPGVHRMEPYRSYFPHAHLLVPETTRLAQRVLVLPTGPAVSVNDISEIGRIVKLAMATAPAIRVRLAETQVEPDVSFREPPQDEG